MARSATATEILELGKRLVAEQSSDDNRDTLLRWMLHRIAELMEAAERAPESEKPAHQARASAAILELWEYRSTLRAIDPLADLTPILRVIGSLDRDRNPWFPRPPQHAATLVADVYSAFRGLILSFLLQTDGFEAVPPTNPLFLSDDENEIRRLLSSWLSEHQQTLLDGRKERASTKSKARTKAEADIYDAKASLVARIQEAREALEDLERAVTGEPPIERESKLTQFLVATTVIVPPEASS